MNKQQQKLIGFALIALPVAGYFALSPWLSSPPPLDSRFTQVAEPPASTNVNDGSPRVAPSFTATALPPTTPPIILLPLDDGARAIVTKSATLKAHTLDADIETQKTREWTAKQARKGAPLPRIVPDLTVLGVGDTLPSNSLTQQPERLNALYDIQLAGLVTATNGQTAAFLSLAGSAPFQVKAGMTIRGVHIRRVTAHSVTLTQGKQTRQLTGEHDG